MLSRLMLLLIRFYQIALSPWFGRQCRFVPSCSQYATDAIQQFGPWKGGYMAAMRILRCHPFGGSGYDPVPTVFRWRCWCSKCEGDSSYTKVRSSSNTDDSNLFNLKE